MSDAHTPSADATSRLLTGLALGAALVGGAVILAPHVLPALGIGSTRTAADAMFLMHSLEHTPDLPVSEEYYLSITDAGSGVAGFLNRSMARYVPFVGRSMAEGGLFTTLATAVTGIGGVMFGRFVKEREGEPYAAWGDMIQYAALATSALIALPTLITGMGVGLLYLAMVMRNHAVTDVVAQCVFHGSGVAGSRMEDMMMGASGLMAALPHALTCGVSVLPVALGMQSWRADTASVDGLRAEITLPDPLLPHVPTTAVVRLTHADGTPLRAEDLAVVHTEKVHLFMVDGSLQDYHHVHPVPTQVPGVFTVPFTPHTANRYRAWVEITPEATGKEHVLRAVLHQPPRRDLPARVSVRNTAEKDGLQFYWEPLGPLVAGQEATVRVQVTEHGLPVKDLEPLLGAYAHLAGFSADGSSILHCHPLGKEPTQPQDHGSGELLFHIHPQTPGPTQFYLQIQRGGREICVPFGHMIASPAKQTDHPHMHAHHQNGVART